MNFSIKNEKSHNLNINYSMGQTINEANEVKFLGLNLDKSLNWKPHIDKVNIGINRFVYVLNRLRRTAATETVLAAYHGYVSSLLKYGLPIFGNSVDINKAFITQKKCVRAICGVAPWISCRPLFKRLNIMPLACMYIAEVCKFVKGNMHLFSMAKDVYPRNTRNAHRLVLPRKASTVFLQRNCYAMSIRIYNDLPDFIKELPMTKFNVQLRKWLQFHNFYSITEYFTHCKKIPTSHNFL